MKLPRLLLLILFLALISIGGCATPQEGGSSLPWAKPESWEGQFSGGPSFNY